ncbi:MAG: asparaginase [candidate division Zixibacteria bacterium]|nr:asparaginase [candidate division Zixibacteria bacterium]
MESTHIPHNAEVTQRDESHAEIGARVIRGEGVEAVHYASVAVVNRDGDLTHYLGDPGQVFFTRSSIKPFQSLPLYLSGAAEHYKFTDKELAIMCASHNGSDEHREVVLSILSKAGNKVEDLQCGSHWPLQMKLFNQYPQNAEDTDSARHNCSGKHSGFLALTRFLKQPIADYLKPDSETQQRIKTAVADSCKFPHAQMLSGTDGCSAPNYAMPLKNLAIGFKNLSNGLSGDPKTAQALKRIKSAMSSHPLMVSGEKRFDYDLMRSFPGNIVCKIGAEGVEAIGFSEPATGIVVKIHDGNERALGPICVEVFKQLGLVSRMEDFPYLRAHESPVISNYRKIRTGQIIPDFKLRRA